jgi:hypothetical protein
VRFRLPRKSSTVFSFAKPELTDLKIGHYIRLQHNGMISIVLGKSLRSRLRTLRSSG